MITLNDLCAHLVPPEEHLQFKTLILDEQRIILVATMTAPKAACPDCHQLTSRIHSDYPRTSRRPALGDDTHPTVLNRAALLLYHLYLWPTDFHPAPAHDRSALCPHHDSAYRKTGRYGAGPRGCRRCPTSEASRVASQPKYTAAARAESGST